MTKSHDYRVGKPKVQAVCKVYLYSYGLKNSIYSSRFSVQTEVHC